MTRELYAFEPFGTMEDVMSGKPIKIMPVGTFYRGDRVLTITPNDLREIERNTVAGLPRFRIPINENHSGVGKVGTVNAVKFMDTGADGAGLYATDYELTDEGKRLVSQKRFDSVSPEVIWKKNDGALYQDPQTGKKIDNVLVGLALTDRPFFGHDNVALFSALPADEFHGDHDQSTHGHGGDGGESGGESQSSPQPRSAEEHAKRMAELRAQKEALGEKLAAMKSARKGGLGKYFGGNKPAKGEEHSDDIVSDLMQYFDVVSEMESSSDSSLEDWMSDMPMDNPKRGNGYTKLRETMKAKFAELMQMLADENENDIPDGAEEGLPAEAQPTTNKGKKVDMPLEGMTTTSTGVTFVATVTPNVFTASAPANADSTEKGQGHMADTQPTATPPAPEFQVSAEEFAALKTKADKAAQLEEQFTALKAQAENFATQLRDTQRARRKDQLMARCEQFMALPVAPADMAEKLQALEEHDSALAKFFDEVLEKMDKQLAQADLFTQKTSAARGGTAETFEDAVAKTVREKFGGDMGHYQDAMTIVTKERPELYAEYTRAYATRR